MSDHLGQFDPSAGEWVRTDEPWGRFERLGPDDEFALALPGEGSP